MGRGTGGEWEGSGLESGEGSPASNPMKGDATATPKSPAPTVPPSHRKAGRPMMDPPLLRLWHWAPRLEEKWRRKWDEKAAGRSVRSGNSWMSSGRPYSVPPFPSSHPPLPSPTRPPLPPTVTPNLSSSPLSFADALTHGPNEEELDRTSPHQSCPPLASSHARHSHFFASINIGTIGGLDEVKGGFGYRKRAGEAGRWSW